ncbi:MAG: hypothetical protein KY463_14675 [Actinobacteria bacterium]|nr:hypothetical protein [Actinomycetota bacterium]
MTRKTLGAFALLMGSLVIVALPGGALGSSDELREAREALERTAQQLQAGLESTVGKTGDATGKVVNKTKQATTGKQRATATDPPTQPPLHGDNPHGQGTVGVVDVDPSAERPLAADPDGGDSGEEVVVGRARGEKNADGTYHGHITVLGLFGNDVIPVDTAPGESKSGPLQPLQESVLDPLCTNTNQQVCLSALTANSVTTENGSTNDFALARASLLGLGIGAADSQGAIAQDTQCQSAGGAANAATVSTSGGTVAEVARSTSTSKSCRDGTVQVQNTSSVIGLGGTGVPLPAAGCANGTPDTQAGLPGLLPIICNAEEIAGAAAVREALSVFALQVGTNSLLKETTAASESLTVAPEAAAQCSDGIDNDGDGLIDAADPGCHTDGDPNNPASYDPNDDDETNPAPRDEGGTAGEDEAEERDDDSEPAAGGGGGPAAVDSGALPFTGADIIGIAMAGLLVLAGGLLMRRREEVRTVR